MGQLDKSCRVRRWAAVGVAVDLDQAQTGDASERSCVAGILRNEESGVQSVWHTQAAASTGKTPAVRFPEGKT